MSFMASTMLSFSPKQLFRAGEKGVWYDPSDMSTLWQDSARTTAVTAVEQPVGCIDDKSGNGFNATQSTSANRPVLSARYNLLTKTEQFDDGVWTKADSTISSTKVTDPLGGTTAQQLYENVATSWHGAYIGAEITATGTLVISCYFKANGRDYAVINTTSGGTNWVSACFDLVNLTATTGQSGTYTSPTTTIVDVGNGWRRCVLQVTTSSTTTAPAFAVSNTANPTYGAFAGFSYAGNTTKGIYIWGADLRVSNDGVGLPAYQRVNTSTDYDTAGFRYYLRHDGTDDALATGSIDFSGTDAVTVWAGVRKLSDAARGTVVELTSSAASNNGSFHLTAPNAASATYAFESKGSALTDAVASTSVAAPITNVLCAYSDISADQNILRVNGVQADSDTGDQGTGNFSNAALYIGSRGSSSLRFNGRIYGLIVRGAASTTGDINDTERWLAGRTGITL